MANVVDLYAVLGVARGSSQEDIRRAFRDLSKYNHPDKLSSDAPAAVRKQWEERFVEILNAYGTLSDADKRKKYDETPSENDIKELMTYGAELVTVAASLKAPGEEPTDFAGRIAFAAAKDVFRMAKTEDGKRKILDFLRRSAKQDT